MDSITRNEMIVTIVLGLMVFLLILRVVGCLDAHEIRRHELRMKALEVEVVDERG